MRHLVLAMLMLTACGAVVLAAKDQPALAAEPVESAEADKPAETEPPAKKDAAKKDAAKKDAAKKDGATKKDGGKPVNQFCAVERESKIDPKVTTTHEGKVIGFCCEGCVDTFKEDPKKYMKDLK